MFQESRCDGDKEQRLKEDRGGECEYSCGCDCGCDGECERSSSK